MTRRFILGLRPAGIFLRDNSELVLCDGLFLLFSAIHGLFRFGFWRKLLSSFLSFHFYLYFLPFHFFFASSVRSDLHSSPALFLSLLFTIYPPHLEFEHFIGARSMASTQDYKTWKVSGTLNHNPSWAVIFSTFSLLLLGFSQVFLWMVTMGLGFGLSFRSGI
jgi:hypothetical protein